MKNGMKIMINAIKIGTRCFTTKFEVRLSFGMNAVSYTHLDVYKRQKYRMLWRRFMVALAKVPSLTPASWAI